MPVILKENRIQHYGPNCVLAASLRDLAAIEDAGWNINGNPVIVSSPWGRCISLDGTADSINQIIEPNLDFIAEDFSFECLIYPTWDTDWPQIFNRASWLVSGWHIFINQGSRLPVFMSHRLGVNTSYAATTAVTLNAWNHIIFSRSGVNWAFYLNGNATGNGATYVNSASHSGHAAIGAWPHNTQEFQGYIEFINIYKCYAMNALDADRRYKRVIGAIMNP